MTTQVFQKLIVLGAVAGSLWMADPATAQKKKVKDTILQKDGKQIRNVEVTATNVDKVAYKQGGKEQSINSALVDRVVWHEPPTAYDKAKAAANRGAHEDAAQLFVTAAKEAKRELIIQDARFLAGRAYLKAAGDSQAKVAAAGKAIEEYIAAAPQGFHVPEAKLTLGRVKILSGDAAGAETLMTGVESEATTAGWPNFWIAQAQYLKAQAQSAQGKHDDARTSYKMVVSTADAALGTGITNKDLLTLQTDARVMQGETYIQQKFYDDALNYFQTLSSSSGSGLKAAAKAGRGQILYLKGKDKGDVRVLRQAQLSLAEASTEADTNAATSAKALYYMGKVLQALGAKEDNARMRARSYFQSVKVSYPKTSWAALARKELES